MQTSSLKIFNNLFWFDLNKNSNTFKLYSYYSYTFILKFEKNLLFCVFSNFLVSICFEIFKIIEWACVDIPINKCAKRYHLNKWWKQCKRTLSHNTSRNKRKSKRDLHQKYRLTPFNLFYGVLGQIILMCGKKKNKEFIIAENQIIP